MSLLYRKILPILNLLNIFLTLSSSMGDSTTLESQLAITINLGWETNDFCSDLGGGRMKS
jgi:hypothetical protein